VSTDAPLRPLPPPRFDDALSAAVPARQVKGPASSLYAASVFLVVALAVVLRFVYLIDQGVLEYDEGWLIDVAQRSAVEWLHGGLKSYSDYKSSPTTWASVLLPLRLFGFSPSSIQYPFALYGVLAVLAIMWLGSLAYGPRTAVVAGLLLAVSPMHILYSRTVGVDSPGAAFVLLAYALLFFSFRGKAGVRNTVGCFLAGIAMGLGATANYKGFACCLVPLVMLWPLAHSVRQLVKCAFAYFCGFMTLLVAWDLALTVLFPGSGGYIRRTFKNPPHMLHSTLWGEGGLLSLPHIREPGFYLRTLLDLDNPAALALAALLPFLAWMAWNSVSERRSDLAVLIAILGPGLVFFLLNFKAPREISYIQPLTAIAAARSVQLIWRTCRRLYPAVLLPVLPAALVATAAIWGLVRSLSPDVLGRSNPFRAAFQVVKGAGGAPRDPGVLVILDQAGPDLYAAETGRRIARVQMGATLADFVQAFDRGYRYWLVDGQFSVYGDSLKYIWPAFDTVRPQMLIPAASYIRLDHFVEHTIQSRKTYSEEVAQYSAWLERWGPNLPMYDLTRLVAPLGWRGSSADWYRVGRGIVAMDRADTSSNSYRVVWNEARPAGVIEATMAVDPNRLPFEGGIALQAGDSASLALYLDLQKEGCTASIVPLTSRGARGAAVASCKTPAADLIRSLRLSWSDGAVRAFINGSAVLSLSRAQPPGPMFGGLVASPAKRFDVVGYGSDLVPPGQP
jgi:4-amino-4-deoxy-L-arabinose transferase-like glycosyltransferase